ncbi:39S ribosomal protein L3, mitochondrial [Nymphon striatum]|nr:39S ribosomal protein L3, mitochondrial [Nymphon striatum]
MSWSVYTGIRYQFLKCLRLSKPIVTLESTLEKSGTLQLGQVRHRSYMKRRSNLPRAWWIPKTIKFFDDNVSPENKDFLKELEQIPSKNLSPLKEEPWPRNSWGPDSRRAGVIARKIGIYPQWFRNGKRVLTTLLQVLDNHVIKYHPPEKFAKTIPGSLCKGNFGALIVGANAGRPQNFTKAYCNMFQESGVVPKKKLTRFLVTDDAKIQPALDMVEFDEDAECSKMADEKVKKFRIGRMFKSRLGSH